MNRTSGLLLASVAASISLTSCTQAPQTRVPDVVEPADAESTITATITPDVTPTPLIGDVAALLQDPPGPMESVEINAYHGEGYESWPGRGRSESMSGCPSADSSPLTDQPLWQTLSFGGHSSGNPIPDGAPWLIAAQVGGTPFPELPRFARLRGHLGDPAFAHCPEADRIFTVEDVVEIYEEKREFTYSQPDYGKWRQYSDPLGRFRLAYPPDWEIAASSDDLITLSSEHWPDSPVTVRVIDGSFDPTAAPGDVDVQTWEDGFWQRPPKELVTSNVPVLTGDVHYCAGGIIDGCIEVVFSHAGNDFVFRHKYPTGFDAHQATLWTFQHIADTFWVEGRATITPTPTPNTILGDGPFWTAERAEEAALRMIPDGPWRVVESRMVTEHEARRLNLCGRFHDDEIPDYSDFGGHPEGVWIVTMRGRMGNRETIYHTYLDAVNGYHLCTAQGGTRPVPGRPVATPTPNARATHQLPAGPVRVLVTELRGHSYARLGRPEGEDEFLIAITVFSMTDDMIEDILVSAKLPDGSDFVTTVLHPEAAEVASTEPPEVAFRLGQLPAGAVAGPFSFVATRMFSPAEVTVSWAGGQVRAGPPPVVQLGYSNLGRFPGWHPPYSIADDDVIPPANVSTGLKVEGVPDPPAERGDLWWCRVIGHSVSGPYVVEQLQQIPCDGPVQPGMAAQVMFLPEGETEWVALDEKGSVSADGNHVVLRTNRPGSYAVGVSAADRLRGISQVDGARAGELRRALYLVRQDLGERTGSDSGFREITDPVFLNFIQSLAGGPLPPEYTVRLDLPGVALACGRAGCVSEAKAFRICETAVATCRDLVTPAKCRLNGDGITCNAMETADQGGLEAADRQACGGRLCVVGAENPVLLDGVRNPSPGVSADRLRTGFVAIGKLNIRVGVVLEAADVLSGVH